MSSKNTQQTWTTPRMLFACHHAILDLYNEKTRHPGTPKWYQIEFPNLWFLMTHNACSKDFRCTLVNLLCAILHVARKSFLDAYSPAKNATARAAKAFKGEPRKFLPNENYLLPWHNKAFYGFRGPAMYQDQSGTHWPKIRHYCDYLLLFKLPPFGKKKSEIPGAVKTYSLIQLVHLLAVSKEDNLTRSRPMLAFLRWFDKSIEDMDWTEDLVNVITMPVKTIKTAWKQVPAEMQKALDNTRKVTLKACREMPTFERKVGAQGPKKRTKPVNDDGTPVKKKMAPKKKEPPGEVDVTIVTPYKRNIEERKFADQVSESVGTSLQRLHIGDNPVDYTSMIQPVVGLAATINAAEKFLRVAFAASNTMVGWTQVTFNEAMEALNDTDEQAAVASGASETLPVNMDIQPVGKHVARNMAISMINSIIPALVEHYQKSQIKTQVPNQRALSMFEDLYGLPEQLRNASKSEKAFGEDIDIDSMASAFAKVQADVRPADCTKARALHTKKGIIHPGTHVLRLANQMIKKDGWMVLNEPGSIQIPPNGEHGEETVVVFDPDFLLKEKQAIRSLALQSQAMDTTAPQAKTTPSNKKTTPDAATKPTSSGKKQTGAQKQAAIKKRKLIAVQKADEASKRPKTKKQTTEEQSFETT